MARAMVRAGFWGSGLMVCLTVGVAAAQAQRIPLRCRLAPGPWQACMMRIEVVGQRWTLELPGHQLDFRHEGTGKVEMQRPPSGRWSPVTSRWTKEQALCWGEVCALGQFPLD